MYKIVQTILETFFQFLASLKSTGLINKKVAIPILLTLSVYSQVFSPYTGPLGAPASVEGGNTPGSGPKQEPTDPGSHGLTSNAGPGAAAGGTQTGGKSWI